MPNDQEQLTLPGQFFVGQELVELEDHARRGTFSGKVLEKKRGLVRSICHALSLGMGVEMVADAFSVSINSVLGIRDRNPEMIEAEKKHVRRKLSRLQFLLTDRIENVLVHFDPETTGLRDLSIALGIISDKLALIDGEPTARVDHGGRREVDPDQVRAALEAMRVASIPVDAEVVSDLSGTANGTAPVPAIADTAAVQGVAHETI